jgi:hypothetical protein
LDFIWGGRGRFCRPLKKFPVREEKKKKKREKKFPARAEIEHAGDEKKKNQREKFWILINDINI